jgi:hypothetical protein
MVGPTIEELIRLLGNVNHNNQVKNDKDLENNKDRRSRLYVEILEAYQKYVERTLVSKIWHRWISFAVVMTILIAVTGSIFLPIVIYFKGIEFEIEEWLALIIPAVVSFLTTFIVLPKIITKYLFDSEEEKRMAEIFKVIENIDLSSDNNKPKE